MRETQENLESTPELNIQTSGDDTTQQIDVNLYLKRVKLGCAFMLVIRCLC